MNARQRLGRLGRRVGEAAARLEGPRQQAWSEVGRRRSELSSGVRALRTAGPGAALGLASRAADRFAQAADGHDPRAAVEQAVQRATRTPTARQLRAARGAVGRAANGFGDDDLRGLLTSPAAHRTLAVAGVTCAAGHLAATAAGVRWLRAATKPPLMLLLAAHTLSSAGPERRASTVPLVAGLALASAGDTALILETDSALLAGILLFSGTHVCYLAGTLTTGGAIRALRARPEIAMAGLACYLPVAAILWNRLGRLRWAVCGYGLLLFSMVAAACASNRGMGVGAVLFAVSDLTIGLRVAGIRFPGQNVFVMLTYCLGQASIAHHWPKTASAAPLADK